MLQPPEQVALVLRASAVQGFQVIRPEGRLSYSAMEVHKLPLHLLGFAEVPWHAVGEPQVLGARTSLGLVFTQTGEESLISPDATLPSFLTAWDNPFS